MDISASEAAWQRHPESLRLAKERAIKAAQEGRPLDSDSIMLSEYIRILGGEPLEKNLARSYKLAAANHVFTLWWNANNLSHNQLDVLLSVLIKIKKRWWGRFFPPIAHLAFREISLALKYDNAFPHQIALAYLKLAWIDYLRSNNKLAIFSIVNALQLEAVIREEKYQPQGLRQLVRILKDAGRLYCRIGGEYRRIGFELLYKAEALANGEAKCKDQALKIRELIKSRDW